jgi:hypothetical protein
MKAKTNKRDNNDYYNDLLTMDSCCGSSHPAHGMHHRMQAGNHYHSSNEYPYNYGPKGIGNHYQCPMKCEGNKTYEQPGYCPVCNMRLMLIK